MFQYSLILVLLIGMVMPIQAPINAVLGKSLGHPLWATIVSLSVSILLVLPLLLLFKAPSPNLSGLGSLPWWAWFGGLSGAVFVGAAVVLAPKIGIAQFTVLIILGQAIMALLLDHFGLFALAQKPINLMKILGIALMVGGVWMVQMGNKAA
ncbi:transporter family-2 protein [Cricetibacter osteomyelitidis]|uniref:Transporter family-2 protein n=2 Tax=Cricetibacter osteomyelitidis TaxID=1521931 RepID=A0A4R2SY47_9PAST|nr:transporter family-2 protein [Cricetibacter osteomyelitidis]